MRSYGVHDTVFEPFRHRCIIAVTIGDPYNGANPRYPLGKYNHTDRSVPAIGTDQTGSVLRVCHR
jgi:hypothetical protein